MVKVNRQPTLAEALQERNKKPEYDMVETHLAGVSLRVEKGRGEDFNKLRGYVGRIARVGARVYKGRMRVKEIQGRLKEPETSIKELAERDGLRGIVSKKGGFSLAVYPTRAITWDVGKLRKSLGDAYSTVVGEDVHFTISVPLNHETEEGPLTSEMATAALHNSLRALGLSPEEIATSEVVYRVDESRLGQMITDGQVSLVEGTGAVDTTWNIKPAPLPNPRPA